MARGYRPVERDQEFLLPPDMSDWLDEGHLVWFVIEAVRRLDTSAFHARSRRGGVGRAGYDPDMLLTLFVYAMAHGVSSSRRIEQLCGTDVAFAVICARDVPDHSVLARFRQQHQEAMGGLLGQTLQLAAELGMVRLGTVALDGTKICANASRDANRGEARLQELASEYLERAGETDRREDALFGQTARGDELPAAVRDRSGRRQRIDDALAQIQARRAADTATSRDRAAKVADCERAVLEGSKGRGRYPNGTDRVAMARARWEREHAKATARYQAFQQAHRNGEPIRGQATVPPDQCWQVRHAWAAYQQEQTKATTRTDTDTDTSTDTTSSTGSSNDTDTSDTDASDTDSSDGTGSDGTSGAGGGSELRANMTDPDSRLLKTRNGWIQGYNCQLSASDDGFILTARATQDANDMNQFIPTMNALTTTAATLAQATGRTDLATIGTLLADAGYDSDTNLAAPGPSRLIANAKRATLARLATTDPATGDPPPDATPREQMNYMLRTAHGHDHYKRRSPLIEGPNAWLKDRRGLRRFARRGLPAAQAELAFAATVTNLLKLMTHGITTTHLRTT